VILSVFHLAYSLIFEASFDTLSVERMTVGS
jgi:hypothetical protein